MNRILTKLIAAERAAIKCRFYSLQRSSCRLSILNPLRQPAEFVCCINTDNTRTTTAVTIKVMSQRLNNDRNGASASIPNINTEVLPNPMANNNNNKQDNNNKPTIVWESVAQQSLESLLNSNINKSSENYYLWNSALPCPMFATYENNDEPRQSEKSLTLRRTYHQSSSFVKQSNLNVAHRLIAGISQLGIDSRSVFTNNERLYQFILPSIPQCFRKLCTSTSKSTTASVSIFSTLFHLTYHINWRQSRCFIHSFGLGIQVYKVINQIKTRIQYNQTNYFVDDVAHFTVFRPLID